MEEVLGELVKGGRAVKTLGNILKGGRVLERLGELLYDGRRRCVGRCTHVMGGGGRGVLDIIRGRSRMTIDPGLPTMPGRSTSGFHQLGRQCLCQVRSAVSSSASPMYGEPHRTKNLL